MPTSLKLSSQEILLIQKALISHRWAVGEDHDEFAAASKLANALTVAHNGGELIFNSEPTEQAR